jgi:hypothetical protein
MLASFERTPNVTGAAGPPSVEPVPTGIANDSRRPTAIYVTELLRGTVVKVPLD